MKAKALLLGLVFAALAALVGALLWDGSGQPRSDSARLVSPGLVRIAGRAAPGETPRGSAGPSGGASTMVREATAVAREAAAVARQATAGSGEERGAAGHEPAQEREEAAREREEPRPAARDPEARHDPARAGSGAGRPDRDAPDGRIEVQAVDTDGDGAADRWTDYAYDASGALVVSEVRTPRFDIETTYDARGNRWISEWYLPDGTLIHQAEYDEQGRVVGLDLMSRDGVLRSRQRYTYDDAGNRVSRDTERERGDGWGPDLHCTYDPACPPPFSDCTESCGPVEE